jgi:hypothetical protein
MFVEQRSPASVPTVLMLCAVAVAFGALAWHTFRPLLNGPEPADHHETDDR